VEEKKVGDHDYKTSDKRLGKYAGVFHFGISYYTLQLARTVDNLIEINITISMATFHLEEK